MNFVGESEIYDYNTFEDLWKDFNSEISEDCSRMRVVR